MSPFDMPYITHWEFHQDLWCQKGRVFIQAIILTYLLTTYSADCLMICSAILTQYQRVTNGWTDTGPCIALCTSASRGKTLPRSGSRYIVTLGQHRAP